MSGILDHAWFNVLGWTLLHSLWEGLVIGLLTWGALVLACRRSAQVRYLLACSGLLVMVLAFLGTAYGLARSAGEGASLGWLQVTLQEIRGVAGEGGMWRQRLEATLPTLVAAWLAGACLMALRLTSGLAWLHFFCLRKAHPVDEAWDRRLKVLGQSLGMHLLPRLRLSDHVDSPLVLGWLRPVILVPTSVLAGMDPLLLETILLHELAHIRRWDYPVNLLQNLAEVLFFYHPALWWVSRQIRRERENCCDDAAAIRCGDPLRYASALAALEALRLPPTHSIHLVPAAKGGSLMLRIRRLIAPEAAATSGPSLLSLTSTLALGAAIALMSLPLQATKADNGADQQEAPPPPPPPGSEVLSVQFSKVRIKYQPPPPAYPKAARERRIEGVVEVKITIGTDGVPTSAKAIAGPTELRSTAENYAKDWRFEPFLEKGKPVKVSFMLNMPFKLR
jgi:bla regulator protein BlaR1